MRKLGPELGVPMHVYGAESHITAVVQLALGIPLDDGMKMTSSIMDALAAEAITSPVADRAKTPRGSPPPTEPIPLIAPGIEQPGAAPPDAPALHTQFSPSTRCVVYGMQSRAVQVLMLALPAFTHVFHSRTYVFG